jgi:hypothetical protein
LDRNPALDFHRPAPRETSLTRTPMTGRTFNSWLYRTIVSSSVNFSTTGMICFPILRASIVILMNSSSLKPLQMIGVSKSLVSASTASSSGLEPASTPKWNGLPKSRISSTTCRDWFTLIG